MFGLHVFWNQISSSFLVGCPATFAFMTDHVPISWRSTIHIGILHVKCVHHLPIPLSWQRNASSLERNASNSILCPSPHPFSVTFPSP